MALATAGISAVLEDGNEATVYVAIGSDATTQSSSNRVALTSTVSGGVITATGVPYAFTGSAGAGATHVLLYDAASSGNLIGAQAITGDQTFNAEGEYNLTALTITGSSS